MSAVKRLAVATVLCCGLVASCGGEPAKEPQPVEVNVTVVVALRSPLIAETLTREVDAPEQCEGALDYSKIKTGSVVTVRDADDKVVGTTELTPPGESENLVVCTWMVRTQIQSDSEYFTAEVGGWKSEPERVSGGGVIFRLDTEKEHDIGSEAEVDPTWSSVG